MKRRTRAHLFNLGLFTTGAVFYATGFGWIGQGWALGLLAALGAGALWRVLRHLNKVRTTVHELDVALFNEPPRPDDWWFGTSPFTDTAPDPVPRRRSHPDPALDLPPDTSELDPTLLPRRRNGGWRS